MQLLLNRKSLEQVQTGVKRRQDGASWKAMANRYRMLIVNAL